MASDPRFGPISVSNEAVTILGRHWWTPPVVVSVPAAVRSFIVRFDREDFRNLTAPPSEGRRSRGPEPVDQAAGGEAPA
jgi:hypothetical protein